MIFCSRCLCDMELKPIIKSLGQRGDCQVCGSSGSFIYDTDKNTDLVVYFDDLISIYTPAQLLQPEYPIEETFLLKDALLNNWNIFENATSSDVYRIVRSICSEKYRENKDVFDAPIGIAELHNLEYVNQHSLLRTNRWEDFVTAVKTQNRFHTKHINTEILERFCSYIRKPYKKGTIFYRGRISSPNGFHTEEMGAPKNELTVAGRANAPGIRCLYLANSIDTTIREVRAGVFDYISIGKFELLEDVIVVDLRLINRISPFIEGLDITEHAINIDHLKKINAEMGKALRRSDSALDYVPTQYISDFIKSIEHNGIPEYAGLEYNSTMNESGYNLAIFYPELFECVDVEVYKIERLHYEPKRID